MGCGRTDFQGGDAGMLYDSITQKLFMLPDETRVWPGHDYRGFSVSTIGREKAHNPRLAGRSREEFIELMGKLKLPKPRRWMWRCRPTNTWAFRTADAGVVPG